MMIIARSTELHVLEHDPGKLYELVDARHEDAPIIGTFFSGPDAQKLLERLARHRPQDSMRKLLRSIQREARRNTDLGNPLL